MTIARKIVADQVAAYLHVPTLVLNRLREGKSYRQRLQEVFCESASAQHGDVGKEWAV